MISNAGCGVRNESDEALRISDCAVGNNECMNFTSQGLSCPADVHSAIRDLYSAFAQRFSTAFRLSSGFLSISLLSGSMPAFAGSWSTTSSNVIFGWSIRFFSM